jgi:hypothetical protein
MPAKDYPPSKLQPKPSIKVWSPGVIKPQPLPGQKGS